MQPKFTFIETLPRDASTRERELQLAEARKHAAIVSHKRRQVTIPVIRVSTGQKRRRSQPSPPKELACTGRESSGVQTCDNDLVADSSTAPNLNGSTKIRKSKGKDSKAVKIFSELLEILWNKDLSNLVVPSYQMDPFYRVPHGNSVSFYEAVDFFTNTVLPNNAPVYAIFNIGNIFTSYTFDLVTRDYFFNVWTAVMQLIRSSFAPQSTSAQKALKHQGAALAQLQRAINASAVSADDYTISGVLMVALLARLYGDKQSHIVHCHYLQKLVEQRGGLDSLVFDGVTRCAILQWECIWALDTGKSVFEGLRRVKLPIYPTMPFSDDLQAQIRSLPVGFQRMACQGKLAMDVLELLGRIADRDLVKPTSPVKEAQWERRKYDDFWEACGCLAEPRPSLQKFLCLALLLFCVNEHSPRRQFRKGMTIFGGPRVYLTRELPDFTCSDAADLECLMWIWMVVIDAWSSDCAQDGELPPNGRKLLTKFRKIFTDPTSWKVAELVLEKFFWSERFSRACEIFWDTKSVHSDAGLQ